MTPLKRRGPWHYEEEYGTLDYTGALVLDIGADYGTTAEFFLERGARHVVALERDPEWRQRLRSWARNKPVTVEPEPLTAANAEALFETHAPDIVKVDCEGCEAILLDLPDDVLAGPRAWVMETHTRELFESFRHRFRALGYRFEVVQEWGDTPGKNGKLCKVVTATREDGP